MSLHLTESYSLYVTGQQAQLRRRGALHRASVTRAGDWPLPQRDLAALDLGAVGGRAGLRPPLRVYVGAAFVKMMVLPVPAGVRHAQEMTPIARAHLTNALGLDAAQWDIVVHPNRDAATMVACAMDRRVVAGARALAGRSGLALQSCAPYAVAVWNALREQGRAGGDASLLAVEADAFSVLVERGGQLVAARTMSHRQEPELVRRELDRLLLADAPDAEKTITVALAAAMEPQANLNGARRMTAPKNKNGQLFADFHDLLCAPDGVLP